MYSSSPIIYKKFKIYNNRDVIIIVGINKKEDAYSICELKRDKKIEIKKYYEIFGKTNYRNLIKKKKGEYLCRCEGILGCIQFLNYPYLYVVTDKEKIGVLFNEHAIYSVKNVLLIPFKETVFEKTNHENNLVQIFYNSANHKYLYFSYTYNLANSLQNNYFIQKEYLKGNIIYNRKYKNNYIWNFYHCKSFLKKNIFICLFVINGYLIQSKIQFSGKYVDITFVARRSYKYAGTRYRKRGINYNGFSANEVESEIILHEKNNISNGILSYVHLRGSVPILWNQSINYKLLKKPKIKCLKTDINFICTKKHFSYLFKKYGYPITVVNLLSKNKYSDENLLSNTYKTCINAINKYIPSTIRILYKHIDLRKSYKIGTKFAQYNLKLLFKFSLNNIGFFFTHNNQVLSMQRGVLRFNCVDCIDRTNAAQIFINIYMFIKFITLINVLKKSDLFISDLKQLFQMCEQLGDAVAKQYAGSMAHKKYTSEQYTNFFIQTKELFTSIKRYYISSFNDLEKQNSINLYLGVIKSKLNEISNAHYLDTYIHNSFFKDFGNDKYWWVLPLEHFYYKVESLLDGPFDRCEKWNKKKKKKLCRHKKKTKLYISKLSLHLKGYTKIVKNINANLKFYNCYSKTNVFKNMYNANNILNIFLKQNSILNLEKYSNINNITKVKRPQGIYTKNNIVNNNQIIFNFFKEICYTFEYYNVYKNNFNKFFKNKNIFRLKIWRLIACYNYLNYLKIFFQFFFLVYYSFCSKYNVIQVYLEHLRIISEWQTIQLSHHETPQTNKTNEINKDKYYLYSDGNNYSQSSFDEESCIVNRIDNLFHISSQFNSYKNDVENIIEQFKKRGNMAIVLHSYINYFYINKFNYNYFILNLSYISEEDNQAVSENRVKNSNDKISHINCENQMDVQTKKKKKKNTELFNEIAMSCSNYQIKGLYAFSSKIIHKKKYYCGKKNDLKSKLIFSANYCFKKKSKLILDNHKKKKKTIINLPRVYSPIYFNVKLLKYFMFVHYYSSSNYNNLANVKKKIGIIDMGKNKDLVEIQNANNIHKSNKAITFYNIQFYLKKIIGMHNGCNINTFFNELYMSYIYSCHYYKKFNLNFQRDIKTLFYNTTNSINNCNNNNNDNNEKKASNIKSEKIQFLHEYNSFENILKEKKKIKLIDEKIHNEINHHYQLANKYMSIDSFQKKYYHEMKYFQEKDQKIKNYFKKNTKLCNISNKNDHSTKIVEFIENVKLINKKQVYKWEHKNVENFNSLYDKLENKMNYHDYCDPLRRKIFA
ncbi:inositol 5-phosphatase, putative [Plasmodium berghei]|uniref:Inositol 5-phosphatase, putative n=2 Tax=Plasmodium berghei TaxID=5821 RepID=A0A509AQN2_PLABA|nr:inositol 5-phosphatase, putative [Plasmodium berghei ANKA]CXI79314.1 inositol 5-phosphatase, putative [Plasmodium berghei]VUC57176.1 inositol 5-phosphatase, putative [Plasmodium berghei ANKA]|eukprot:XP_034422955.1 inositol 5-phosphatase, putative [Plasmodium berghei ANKA]